MLGGASKTRDRPRGKLIVFEGLDRAGKSTQCERLVENMRTRSHLRVNKYRFPDRTTPIGKMIDSYLKGGSAQEDHVIHLLFSANRWELAESIKADLQDGIDVVIDRYYYSGCVYSAAKMNPSLSLHWARKPEEGLPRPDMCIFLDISPSEAAKRGGFGSEKYERDEMQRQVRKTFYALRESPDGIDFVVFNSARPIEELEEVILAEVMTRIAEVDKTGESIRTVQPW